jgi:2-oxoacid dehydrogenases acyltransferase (catalytic domain)
MAMPVAGSFVEERRSGGAMSASTSPRATGVPGKSSIYSWRRSCAIVCTSDQKPGRLFRWNAACTPRCMTIRRSLGLGAAMNGAGQKLLGWRRVAGAMWRAPDDPQIYGALDVDARPILAFIERARAAGHHVTPTHLVGRALAHALVEVPDLNVRIRRGRARPRSSVDVFFITAVAGGRDLSGVKIAGAAGKPAIEIAAELAHRSRAMKQGGDTDFARTKQMTDRLPAFLLRAALRATAFLTQELRLDISRLALHREPFGSAMVTSVGMLGLPRGFAPLAWMYDVPLLILAGEIDEQPVAVDGRVEVRPVLPITATIDHRYVDGWHVAKAMTAFRAYLAAPERFEPALLPVTSSPVRPVQIVR